MPVQIQDASVILAGSIFKLDLKTAFVDGVRTSTPEGAKVTIAAEDGFAVVTIKQVDLPKLAPIVGDWVLWLVRPSLWSIDGSQAFSTAFVRVVDYGDLDSLQSTLTSTSSAPTKS
jgi:hypothetical protein